MYILFSESLPRQAKIVTMSETGYRQGALDLTTAITAQQTALAARLNFLQTATRYFQSLVELERSVGRPIITEMVSTTKEQQK
jgi:outer membrane protein TolC